MLRAQRTKTLKWQLTLRLAFPMQPNPKHHQQMCRMRIWLRRATWINHHHYSLLLLILVCVHVVLCHHWCAQHITAQHNKAQNSTAQEHGENTTNNRKAHTRTTTQHTRKYTQTKTQTQAPPHPPWQCRDGVMFNRYKYVLGIPSWLDRQLINIYGSFSFVSSL
jgi:hypothetical protein